MSLQCPPTPVQVLTGHLDAIASACEALLALQHKRVDPHRLLRIEFTAVAHTLQVRHDVQEIAVEDAAPRSQIALFLNVTECLEDAVTRSPVPRREATGQYLIGGRISASTLLALAAAVRDVLGVWYPVPGGDEETQSITVPISETLVWATGPDVA